MGREQEIRGGLFYMYVASFDTKIIHVLTIYKIFKFSITTILVLREKRKMIHNIFNLNNIYMLYNNITQFK